MRCFLYFLFLMGEEKLPVLAKEITWKAYIETIYLQNSNK